MAGSSMEQRGCAVITGALGGLGSAMVRRLRRNGAQVVACDRRSDDAEEWLAALTPEERKGVVFRPLDVTREDDVAALRGWLDDQGLHVWALVNNAGIQGAGRIAGFDVRRWSLVMRVNLEGTFLMTRTFAGPMADRGFGRIVNLASLYAYHPGRGQHPYAAAKAAITGFTRSVALELASQGVTVNAIAPGYILHERLQDLFGDGSTDTLLSRVPARRAGRPEEIAATVEFLLSEDAGYMTGQTLHVNGGLYLPG